MKFRYLLDPLLIVGTTTASFNLAGRMRFWKLEWIRNSRTLITDETVLLILKERSTAKSPYKVN